MKRFMFVLMVATVLFVGIKIFQKGLNPCQWDDARMQKTISEKIIRFHVIANSDSEEDQALKMKVKERVVSYVQELLKNSESLEQSRRLLEEAEGEIVEIASNCIREEGYDYSVQAGIEHTYFPIKNYGDCTFPAGQYEAFCIRIGESKGKNWWCVLYPPLCFVDISHGVMGTECQDTMSGILTDEEIDYISGKKIKMRFRYLTFLNDLFNL